jgi:hypothetical protein
MRPTDGDERVTDEQARALIARAAELDADRGNGSTIGILRAVVEQAGISSEAFEAAVKEARESPRGPAESPRTDWSQRWRRAGVRTLARFASGWTGVMVTVGVLSGTIGGPGFGPRLIGLFTISTFAVLAGHLVALLLTSRANAASERHPGFRSVVTGALTPFAFVGLQISQIIMTPMSIQKSSIIWFALSGLLTLVISAINPAGPDGILRRSTTVTSAESDGRTWWDSLFTRFHLGIFEGDARTVAP